MKLDLKTQLKQTTALAHLKLTSDEESKILAQLTEALDAVKVLKELDTSKTKPLSHPTNLSNVTREDKVMPSLSQEDALSQAKRTYKGYFLTEAVIEK